MAGAPKGNTNSLKHGLYARHFNDDQRIGLKKMHWQDHRHEVFLHRTIGEQIQLQINLELSRKPVNVSNLVALVNSLNLNTATIGSESRTHSLLNGVDENVGDALSEALGDVPFDQPDDGT